MLHNESFRARIIDKKYLTRYDKMKIIVEIENRPIKKVRLTNGCTGFN